MAPLYVVGVVLISITLIGVMLRKNNFGHGYVVPAVELRGERTARWLPQMTANYRNLTRTFHQRYMYITTKIMYLTAILQQPSNNFTSMSHVECMLYTRKLQYCVLRVTLLSDSCEQHTFNLCSFLSVDASAEQKRSGKVAK